MATIADLIQKIQDSNAGEMDDRNIKHAEILSEIKSSIVVLKEVNNSIKNIKTGSSSLLPNLSGLLTPFKFLFNLVTSPLKTITNGLTALKNGILAPFKALGDKIKSAFNFISDKLKSVWEGAGNIFKSIFKPKEDTGQIGLMKDLGAKIDISNNILTEIYNEILAINQRFANYIAAKKNQQGDLLENRLERNRNTSGNRNTGPTPGNGNNGILTNLLGFIPSLSLLGSALLALGASITGFDDFLKATRLPAIFTSFKNVILGVKNFVVGIGKSVIIFITDISKSIRNFLKPITTAISGIFGKIGLAFGKVGDFLKPLGSVFKGLGKFGMTLMKPLKAILTFLRINPITSLFISLIDFFVGFGKGFFGTEGTFGQKLLAGLEGGILGIITGITDAIDLVFIKFPAWIAEKLGFDGLAETIRSFSLTKLVTEMWQNIKMLFSDGGKGFKLMGSMIKDIVLLQVAKIGNFLEEAFYGLITMIQNIPDKLYLLAANNLKFSIPSIGFDKPDWLGGGRVNLIKGFEAGFGDAAGIKTAQDNISGRDAALIQRKNVNRAEENEILKRLSQNASDLNKQMQQPVVIQQNNVAGGTTNSNTTVLNSSLPATYDYADAVGGAI